MSLTVRATRPTDLAACLDIVHGRYAYADADQRMALAYWSHLLESRAGFSSVLTDVAGPDEPKILVFGLSAFVSEDFMQYLLTTSPPHLGLAAARCWASGKRVHLNRKEIARDNAGDGLNVLTIGFGTRPGLAPDVDLQARGRMVGALVESLAGYRLRRLAHEAFGTELHAFNLSGGLRVIRSFPTQPPVVPCRRDGPPTHIYGLTREDSSDAGPHWWPFFHPLEPRLGLTGVEQETIEAALDNATDAEIAEALAVSIWTVKKRWQTIYSKVEQIAPGVLPEGPLGDSAGGAPVAERRRHLLAYIRQHLEEIRPRGTVAKEPRAAAAGAR
jgi:hypothetical protein